MKSSCLRAKSARFCSCSCGCDTFIIQQQSGNKLTPVLVCVKLLCWIHAGATCCRSGNNTVQVSNPHPASSQRCNACTFCCESGWAGGGWSRGVFVSGDSPQLQEGAAIKNGEDEGEAIQQNCPQWAPVPKLLTNQKKIIWTKRRELSGAVL